MCPLDAKPNFRDIQLDLLTPCFIAGADQSKAEAFRPPEFKAMLRFWWRCAHPWAPEALQRAETLLFGGTNFGQGLRVIPVSGFSAAAAFRTNSGSPIDGPVLADLGPYLAGPGLVKGRNLLRPVIYPLNNNETACLPTIHYRLILPRYTTVVTPTGSAKRPLTDTEILLNDRGLDCALWLLSALGGIGARTRRGFGRLQVTNCMSDWLPPLEAETLDGAKAALSDGIRKIRAYARVASDIIESRRTVDAEYLEARMEEAVGALDKIPDEIPKHTAISSHTRLVVGTKKDEDGFFDKASNAHDAGYDDFYRFRRFLGAYGQFGPQATLRRHAGENGVDHLWRSKMASRHSKPGTAQPAPAATYFGLPLPGQMTPKTGAAQDTQISREVNIDLVSVADTDLRRVSPLFISVLRFGKGKYVPLYAYIKSLFKPADSRIVCEVIESTIRRPPGGRREKRETMRWSADLAEPVTDAVADFLTKITTEKKTSKGFGCPHGNWIELR